MSSILEKKFEKKVCDELQTLFPGAVILKLDPLYIQGIPDRLILFRNKWASLEIKREYNSNIQPNQEHYISMLDSMSYASFLHPENKKEVFDDLQRLFSRHRKLSRLP